MEYSIVYSKRKTLSIAVKPGGAVVVRAPYSVDQQTIARFLSQKQDWIARAVEKQTEKTVKPTDPEETALLKKKAAELLPCRVRAWSKITGLTPKKVGITSAKTRFGSCSAAGNINFSCYLMLYPEPAIDYVILHELAHLKHLDHSDRFYKLIEKYMPDYKERAKLLKK